VWHTFDICWCQLLLPFIHGCNFHQFLHLSTVVMVWWEAGTVKWLIIWGVMAPWEIMLCSWVFQLVELGCWCGCCWNFDYRFHLFLGAFLVPHGIGCGCWGTCLILTENTWPLKLTEITQPCIHMCDGLFICQLYLLPDLLEEMDCKEDTPLKLPFCIIHHPLTVDNSDMN
jgi:hypothetical protein